MTKSKTPTAISKHCVAIKPGLSDGFTLRDPAHHVRSDEPGRTIEAPAVFEMPAGATGSWFVRSDEHGRPVETHDNTEALDAFTARYAPFFNTLKA